MANKKKIEDRKKILQTKRTEQTVRRVGIIVIAIVVIGLIFIMVRNQSYEPVDEVPATILPVTQDSAVDEPTQEVSSKLYAAKPEMIIDVTKKYLATFDMENGGEFVIELFADKTPITVNNFVFLARDGFYDGVTFHRVIEGFMTQGGDPTGTGFGGPGYQFEDEFRDDLVFDRAGLLAMANSGPNTNGSQFFITLGAPDWLNGVHTIFGQVIEGMDVVNAITRTEPGLGLPADVIETITITEE